MTVAHRKHPGKSAAEFEIRAGRPSDAGPIQRLARRSGLSAWPEDDYQAFVGTTAYDLRVAQQPISGKVVGYCLLRRIPPEVELIQLAVESTVRRHGIGSALLRGCLRSAARRGHRRCFLEVRAESAAAVQFYLAHSFVEISRRAGYYSDPPDDAIVMARELDPPAGSFS